MKKVYKIITIFAMSKFSFVTNVIANNVFSIFQKDGVKNEI